jgi:PRTRC genetic system protein C
MSLIPKSYRERGGLNITMTIETMAREFRYDGLRLPDPNAKLSVDEVRTAFSATYPEIATAAATGPEAVGNKLVYHFTKAIEIRGASAFFGGAPFQGSCV